MIKRFTSARVQLACWLSLGVLFTGAGCGSESTKPGGSGKCPQGQFDVDGRCWDAGKRCADYDATSLEVCQTAEDSLRCDWQPSTKTCIPGDDRTDSACASGEFEANGRCYERGQACADYNATAKQVCETRNDELSCEWNASSRTCAPGTEAGQSSRCAAGQFAAAGDCWREQTSCAGYRGTKKDVCENQHDSLSCAWDESADDCESASDGGRCRRGEFEWDGACRREGDECRDYDRTDAGLCENDYDDLNCSWDEDRERCTLYEEDEEDGEDEDRGSCGRGEFEWNGDCYRKGRDCEDYDDTEEEVCENGHDDLRCSWDPDRNSCHERDGSRRDRDEDERAADDDDDDDGADEDDHGRGRCGHGEFWVPDRHWWWKGYGRCYEIADRCSQYSGLGFSVCKNPYDNLHCHWSWHSRRCY
jgi:hypothetical protein